jgi:hypothetical protein
MLEAEEKAAARLFRDREQAALDQSFVDDPPDYEPPNWIAVYRHGCPARANRSSALELPEVYKASPRLTVESSEAGVHTPYFSSEWRPRDVDLWQIPQGRFGFIYRQGRCRLCARTARSRKGRLVDAWQRPPLFGRAT